MAIVHFERGRIIETTPEIVSCLWENWDIYDALLDKKWRIKKQKEGVWVANRQGIKGKVELLECQKSMNSGIFKFIATAEKHGFQVSAPCTLKYSVTSDGKTSVMGIIDVEGKGLVSIGMKIYEKLIYKFADEIIEGGEITSTMIFNNLKKAKEKLTGEQQGILDKYLGGVILRKEELPVPISLLNIIPLNGESLVRFEMSLPKPRRIQGKVKVDERIDRIMEKAGKILRFGDIYTTLSRKPTKIDKRDSLNEAGKEFYGEAIKLGHELYSSYISSDIHGYLNSMLDHSSDFRFMIKAEGRDAKLPWEILHNGEDFLCLKTRMSRVIMNRAFTSEIRSNKISTFKGVLIVGSNPRNDLENVEREAEIVSQTLKKIEGINVKLLTGIDATKDNVVSEIETGNYQVLHYSGHSYYDRENPMLSHLLLSRERELMAHELARLSKGEKLQLVFLNSCSSGVGGGLGVGVMGLADSFIKVGVPYVIGMLWSISDTGAILLAEEFYNRLLITKDPGESLQKARLKIGERFDWKDPVWAAPIMYG